MKGLLITLELVCVVIIALLLTSEGYKLVREIDAPTNRAQVAANPSDMMGYLLELRQNLVQRKMTEGHFAVIFKTSANDFALHLKTVDRVIERLAIIEDMPENEVTYQVALDDIRGIVRELPRLAMRCLWVNYWFIITPTAILSLYLLFLPLIKQIRHDLSR